MMLFSLGIGRDRFLRHESFRLESIGVLPFIIAVFIIAHSPCPVNISYLIITNDIVVLQLM